MTDPDIAKLQEEVNGKASALTTGIFIVLAWIAFYGINGKADDAKKEVNELRARIEALEKVTK